MVPVASTPSSTTRPVVGSKSPATMLKIVLLPQPEGPIRLTNRPAATDSVTGASAWNTPAGVLNDILMFSTRSFGGAEDIRRLHGGRADGASATLAHVPAKWIPVRAQEQAPMNDSRAR